MAPLPTNRIILSKYALLNFHNVKTCVVLEYILVFRELVTYFYASIHICAAKINENLMQAAQPNFHQLMQSLAAFDLVYITLNILMFGLPTIVPGQAAQDIFITHGSSLRYCSQNNDILGYHIMLSDINTYGQTDMMDKAICKGRSRLKYVQCTVH